MNQTLQKYLAAGASIGSIIAILLQLDADTSAIFLTAVGSLLTSAFYIYKTINNKVIKTKKK